MQKNATALTILATKPSGRLAGRLSEMGITVLAVEEIEGNVDRYVLSERVAIERRTASSFLRGIQDKTLFTSAIYLQENFDAPILILEGEVDHAYTTFHPQAVRGALTAMVVSYGVTVLSAPDIEETAHLIAMATRQEQVGIPEISLVPKRKAINLADLQRRIVEMLPGCGVAMARDLLQYFGSIRRIANATEGELSNVRGVGPKKASGIFKAFNAIYDAIGTERDLEDAIEASPALLFEQPVTLVARQHFIFSDGGQRHIVDLVFFDGDANELLLVELKLGRLSGEHFQQIRRYLDRARESSLLHSYLTKGAKIRGILATIAECEFNPPESDVTVHIVDEVQASEVLKQLRENRLVALVSSV
jgi:ERCC4-type nuclease